MLVAEVKTSSERRQLRLKGTNGDDLFGLVVTLKVNNLKYTL
jgi:hypothetical protein